MVAQLGANDLEQFRGPYPDLLEAATGIRPEQGGLHVLLERLGVRSTQRLALSVSGSGLVAALWPAELKTQASYLYGGRLATPLIAKARECGWSVEASPHLAFRNSSPPQRLYMSPALDAAEYARRWETTDLDHVGQYTLTEVTRTLWPWLKERGYADDADDEVLSLFLTGQLGKRPAFLRPGLRLKGQFSYERHRTQEGFSRLATEIREDVDAILGAAGEPPLIASPSSARASLKSSIQ